MLGYRPITRLNRRVLASTAALSTLLLSPALAVADPPDYYPDDYASTIEQSRSEDGVLVYSNVGEMNWRPLLDAFNEEYPWIDVQTLDLGSSEVFERFYAEIATGASETDVVVSHSAASWLDFIESGSVDEDYVSAEDEMLPDWSEPSPGVYTISVDPFFIAYNKALLPEDQWPTSISDIVTLAETQPDQFAHRIATGVPMSNAASQNLSNTYIQHVGAERALEQYQALGNVVDVYRSAGQIMEKITSGELLIGYFLSGIQVFPLLDDPARAQILGYSFPSDGTVMLMRHIAIADSAPNPASAQLFVDFVLSEEGQTALASGGLMPYRNDVELPDGPTGYTYQKVADEVGEENLINTEFDPAIMIPSDELIEAVNDALRVVQ